jgi:hypothetical protein
MKVEQKGHTVTIKDTQGDLVSFLMKVTHEYKSFEKYNIILDIALHKDLTLKQINTFLPLIKLHSKAKKSIVIVADGVNFTNVSEHITIVPTLLEAHDIIEMEEIERDLGF